MPYMRRVGSIQYIKGKKWAMPMVSPILKARLGGVFLMDTSRGTKAIQASRDHWVSGKQSVRRSPLANGGKKCITWGMDFNTFIKVGYVSCFSELGVS